MEGALSNFHRAYLLLPRANSKQNGDRAQQVAKLGPNKTQCLAVKLKALKIAAPQHR